ncbi:hypothetical protein PpBr36_05044 [Pyricularia pennisetigena]|uniref:hypothetical protein n=1 Tax=Pyricularia pennisetigena TaxID=1578925 RepID=UPI0011507988|nr:hypothetical protein PpBr36_05044 [Pyricularia pennisetigena]TLS26233.1 hypothetical protein PpBr36_05044 [Pyricularia pennisetigena]
MVPAPGARGLFLGVAAAVADGAPVSDVDALAASLFEAGALDGLFLCQPRCQNVERVDSASPYHFAHDEAAVLLADLDSHGEIGRAGSCDAYGLHGDEEECERGLRDGHFDVFVIGALVGLE